ncbi:hypothetical protein GcC1_056022 [Golovinomyces cichoracearum]|uniref:Uncharacterized protein n=1 Tax=Golovinomyces cichoracearum TaxID=62708 RepID=A0A420IV47_9PEZI|nr:hypothetical protein GcC1_056022 [Golovinomyces cichoracearum]
MSFDETFVTPEIETYTAEQRESNYFSIELENAISGEVDEQIPSSPSNDEDVSEKNFLEMSVNENTEKDEKFVVDEASVISEKEITLEKEDNSDDVSIESENAKTEGGNEQNVESTPDGEVISEELSFQKSLLENAENDEKVTVDHTSMILEKEIILAEVDNADDHRLESENKKVDGLNEQTLLPPFDDEKISKNHIFEEPVLQNADSSEKVQYDEISVTSEKELVIVDVDDSDNYPHESEITILEAMNEQSVEPSMDDSNVGKPISIETPIINDEEIGEEIIFDDTLLTIEKERKSLEQVDYNDHPLESENKNIDGMNEQSVSPPPDDEDVPEKLPHDIIILESAEISEEVSMSETSIKSKEETVRADLEDFDDNPLESENTKIDGVNEQSVSLPPDDEDVSERLSLEIPVLEKTGNDEKVSFDVTSMTSEKDTATAEQRDSDDHPIELENTQIEAIEELSPISTLDDINVSEPILDEIFRAENMEMGEGAQTDKISLAVQEEADLADVEDSDEKRIELENAQVEITDVGNIEPQLNDLDISESLPVKLSVPEDKETGGGITLDELSSTSTKAIVNAEFFDSGNRFEEVEISQIEAPDVENVKPLLDDTHIGESISVEISIHEDEDIGKEVFLGETSITSDKVTDDTEFVDIEVEIPAETSAAILKKNELSDDKTKIGFSTDEIRTTSQTDEIFKETISEEVGYKANAIASMETAHENFKTGKHKNIDDSQSIHEKSIMKGKEVADRSMQNISTEAVDVNDISTTLSEDFDDEESLKIHNIRSPIESFTGIHSADAHRQAESHNLNLEQIESLAKLEQKAEDSSSRKDLNSLDTLQVKKTRCLDNHDCVEPGKDKKISGEEYLIGQNECECRVVTRKRSEKFEELLRIFEDEQHE